MANIYGTDNYDGRNDVGNGRIRRASNELQNWIDSQKQFMQAKVSVIQMFHW